LGGDGLAAMAGTAAAGVADIATKRVGR